MGTKADEERPRAVVVTAPRVTLSWRMVQAIRALDWEGAEVRHPAAGKPFLYCEDIDGLRDRIRTYSGPWMACLKGEVGGALYGRIGPAL
jgi:hypothetical protein